MARVEWIRFLEGVGYGAYELIELRIPKRNAELTHRSIDGIRAAQHRLWLGDHRGALTEARKVVEAFGGGHHSSEWQTVWLKKRRVAHQDVFRLYLERVVGEGLQAFTEAEQAWSKMSNEGALDSYLRSLDPTKLQDVVSYLVGYEEEFVPAHVVNGSVVLLNLLPGVPDRQRAIFDFGPHVAFRRVVYRLVRSLKSPEAIEDAVRSILPRLTRLSAKADLITMIGHRENTGHKLVSEHTARRFEEELRREVLAASDDSLAAEDDLVRTFFLVRENTPGAEPVMCIPKSPSVTLAVLKSARSDVRSQEMGIRAIRTCPRLQWDLLVELYGGEDTLRRRIEELKDSQVSGAGDVLELAEKYLEGWRPGDFGEE